jgi:mannan endo-1,4-beta-mannosidase
MDKRELKAVLCLNNFWHWSGGFAQYVSWAEGSAIPYPPQQASYAVFEDYSSRFYSSDLARKWYADFLKTITGRVNTVTGVPYRRDPTIFSWELANEPRGISHYDDFINWVGESSKYLRGNVEQWVTVGSEGVTPFQPEKDVEEAHAFDAVDYMTYHIWVQNWGVYNPNSDSVNDAIDFARKYTEKNLKIGNKLGKPIILEEFGLARDGGAFDPKSGTSARDTYFATMLKELDTLVGISFWAFAGEGKPKNTGGIWDVGDPFTGDPPHEPQGWYSVYSTDHSTLEIFKRAK